MIILPFNKFPDATFLGEYIFIIPANDKIN